MRYVTCNFCRQDDTVLVNQGYDLLLNRREQVYQLVRCRHCGLIYQNPQLTMEEIPYHYPDSYRYFPSDIQHEGSPLVSLDRLYGLNRLCRQIMRHHSQPGKLLDIGCATGLFLDAMQKQGWQVSGVELNAQAAKYARETFYLDVKTCTLEEAAFTDGSFDVVTLWGVFEHLSDPKMTLAEIVRVLRPGGLLVTNLPNPTCLEARLFGANWVGWDRPRHLHLFTPEVIQKYLVEAGLRLKRMESFNGRLNVTLLNIEFCCKNKGISPNIWQPWLGFLYNWPLRLLLWPVYRLGEVLNQTMNITVFATKDK